MPVVNPLPPAVFAQQGPGAAAPAPLRRRECLERGEAARRSRRPALPLQGAPGSGWVTALPRLRHSPRQGCTLPGAGDPSQHCRHLRTQCSGQGGLRGRDQELQSPQKQESRADLGQGLNCPQAQWPVSHPLSVHNTCDRVWCCVRPLPSLQLSGAGCPVSSGHPVSWSPCIPSHLCPLALFCAAPDVLAGPSCCPGRNSTCGTACL